MNDSAKLSSELHDIKQMMERSSRFISLSGLSGISAGICALIGAWLGNETINSYGVEANRLRRSIDDNYTLLNVYSLYSRLFQIALVTFIAALISAFIFTYRRSKITNVPIWGSTAKRLIINVTIPIITGGIFLLALINNGVFGLVAPGCLIFYGLGVLNASKYTLPETRYLGYSEILIGLINLLFIGYGLFFWALGFGFMHIIYGVFMWWKYERN